MRMRWLDALVLVYGILLITLALYAYFVAHSLPSLIFGGGSGILEIGFAALTRSNPRVGRIGSAVVALLIAGKFVPECFKPNPKWDFVLLAASSVVVFVCLLGGHFYAMSKRKAETPPKTA